MMDLLEKLKSPDVKERREAAQYLIDRTMFDWVADRDEREIDFAISDLAEALSDEDSEVRELVIKAIRIQQYEFDAKSVFEAIPRIIEVLMDPDRDHIRSRASIILRDAVVEGYDISKNISKLIPLLLDSNESVKFGIADALTYFYAINQRWDEVKNLLKHPDKDVRQEASGTLGQYEIRKRVEISPIIPALKDLLKDENKEVQFVTARSLSKFVNEVRELKLIIDILISFASDADTKIKNNSISSLRDLISSRINCTSKFPKKYWNIFDPIVQMFEKLLTNGTATQKKFVAEILTQFYLHTRQYEEVESLFQIQDAKIRKEVVDELYGCSSLYCEVDYKPIIPSLVRIFLSDENVEVAKSAENRLESIADRKEEYAKLIFGELEKRDYDLNIIWKFIEYLRKSMHHNILSELDAKLKAVAPRKKENFLQEYLENTEPVVREWAAYNLFVISCYENVTILSSLPKLTKRLKDKDFFVIYNTLRALYEIAKSTSIVETLPLIVELLLSKIEELRVQAIETLNVETRHQSDISEALPIIQEILLKDPSSNVRAQAAIFFYETSTNQIDISLAKDGLLEALTDEYDVVRNFSAWTFARNLMNKSLAQWLLNEIKSRNIKKEASIRELIKSCKNSLKI